MLNKKEKCELKETKKFFYYFNNMVKIEEDESLIKSVLVESEQKN